MSMNSLIGTNLSAAADGKAVVGKKNIQGLLANVLFGNSILNVGGKTAKAIKSDKNSLIFGQQNPAGIKGAFAEKLKKILAMPITDGTAVDLKVKQSNSQQKSEAVQTVSLSLTKLIKKEPKNALPAETINTPAENSNAKFTPQLTPLPALSKNSTTAFINYTGTKPTSEKTRFSAQVIDKNNTEKLFENKNASANKSAGQSQKSSLLKPADTSTKTVDTKTNFSPAAKNTNITASDIKSENLNMFSQIAAAKDSIPAKTNQAESKNQNTLFRQNSGLKSDIPKIQTNAKNSSQMSFGQGLAGRGAFTKINQKTQIVQNISLDDNKPNNSQMFIIGDAKSDTIQDDVSPSSAVTDLKNDLQTASKEISRQVADSISSAANSGTKQITIRLNPPELGRVVIKISQQTSHIDAVLEASRPETKDQLQQAFSQVSKNLAESGISLRQFEVRYAEQSRGGFESAFSQFNQPQNGSGEQHFQKQDPSEGFFNQPGQVLNIKNLPPEENFSQGHFSARSVNMLA
jgi:flagellar hook-length control protein FliK